MYFSPSKPNLIYGIHPVLEAISAGKTIDKIFIQKGIKKENISQILREASDIEAPVLFVPVEKLDRLTKGNHQGVVAFLSPVQFFNWEDILPQVYEKGEVPLFLIADSITDVRNFGAITRTALGAGVQAVIIPQSGAAAINEDAVKSSAGALTKINLCRVKNLLQTVKQMKLNGIHVIAAEAKASKFIYETDLKIPLAIIMGSEDEGIDANVLKQADELVKIPITKTLDSYNVSVATGMILYEVMKQRN